MECFGAEASAFTTERLLGQAVTLEYDIERRDIYGRRLAAELDARRHRRGLWRDC